MIHHFKYELNRILGIIIIKQFVVSKTFLHPTDHLCVVLKKNIFFNSFAFQDEWRKCLKWWTEDKIWAVKRNETKKIILTFNYFEKKITFLFCVRVCGHPLGPLPSPDLTEKNGKLRIEATSFFFLKFTRCSVSYFVSREVCQVNVFLCSIHRAFDFQLKVVFRFSLFFLSEHFQLQVFIIFVAAQSRNVQFRRKQSADFNFCFFIFVFVWIISIQNRNQN